MIRSQWLCSFRRNQFSIISIVDKISHIAITPKWQFTENEMTEIINGGESLFSSGAQSLLLTCQCWTAARSLQPCT